MKFIKGILLFFICPMLLLGVGFWAGMKSVTFFYPGAVAQEDYHTEKVVLEKDFENPTEEFQLTEATEGEDIAEILQETSVSGETLCVDTEYVLEETDIIRETVVETSWKLPDRYVGMDREQFVEAMEAYEAYPPLMELERGFISLEVLSFSRDKVVVQMNYQYLEPGTCYYLAVKDNEVVVYQEDKETIYINTGIVFEELPEALQLELMQMIWIPDEESLYDFLEAYSS